MFTSALVGAFILTCLVIELTPGPNMGYLVLLSAREGRRVGLFAVAGITLGLAIVGFAAAAGVALVVTSHPVLYETLRWAGVGYMLWLAWDAWTGREKEASGESVALGTYFRRGLITNLLNPKAFIFYVTILPRFSEVDASFGAISFLSFLYVAVATAIHLCLVAIAGAAQPWLADPRRTVTARRVFAVLLALIALWFALTTRSA